MDTQRLARVNRPAFQALPEPYQADDCLEFSYRDGQLFCSPKEDQKEAVGTWRAVFIPEDQAWVQDDNTLL